MADAMSALQRFDKAKREMGHLVKDASNPHFKSRYATLRQCHDVVCKPLFDNGFTIVETCSDLLQKIEIVDIETGHPVTSSSLPLVSKDPNDPQKLGSAQTYARRYLVTTVCGLTPIDDDGNAASSRYEVDWKGEFNKKAAKLPESKRSTARDIYKDKGKSWEEKCHSLDRLIEADDV
jgi:hypothetical protein